MMHVDIRTETEMNGIFISANFSGCVNWKKLVFYSALLHNNSVWKSSKISHFTTFCYVYYCWKSTFVMHYFKNVILANFGFAKIHKWDIFGDFQTQCVTRCQRLAFEFLDELLIIRDLCPYFLFSHAADY